MSKLIYSFELKEKYRKIKPFKCEFKDGINIIVGENGSGKSSILQLMTGEKCEKLFSTKFKAGTKNYKIIDTEKDNPRFRQGDYSGFTLMSHFTSHGETILPLVKACEDFKNEVIFIDEPEAGVSLKNQKQIITAFKKSVKNGCQLLVTTHSYVLISKVKEIFCLNSFQWISSKEYLKKVL